MTASGWMPTATAEQLAGRARVLERIRGFFAERLILEVQTPVLTRAGVTDPHLESLPAGPGKRFLRTSPEHYHKRLLAAGIGDLYEIGPVFRGGESGRRHAAEFTLVEWYRVGWSWEALAGEVTELIQDVRRPAPPWPVRQVSWQMLAESVLGINPLRTGRDQWDALIAAAPADMDRPEQLDWLFATRLQPALPAEVITVIHDFPPEQAALARIRPGDTPVAERFEVFAGGVELANGYRELADPAEQRRRFEIDNERRRRLGRQQMPLDEHFLAALDAGLPECAGVALGLERLLMAITGADDIARTRAF